MKKKWTAAIVCVIALIAVLAGIFGSGHTTQVNSSTTTKAETTVSSTTETTTTAASTTKATTQSSASAFKYASLPAYSGQAYTVVHNNVPYFSAKELSNARTSFESYHALDSFGRCGVCKASIGKDIMPTEKRGEIGSVKPTGWHLVKYDNVDGKYLYNRCHLIGYQLSGENANVCNLITGTRYLNVDGMLPFENMTADYVKETGKHVLYRVTPIFSGNDLVARGVLMEAESVEDGGSGVEFCVFCYNVQPGITIDYATGDSSASGQASTAVEKTTDVTGTYILNTNTKKFHKSSCSSVKKMSSKNKKTYHGSRSELLREGYTPCKSCNP